MGPDPRDPERALSLRLDHLIYAVRDLDAAADRFASEYGLGSAPGGRHRGWGTANAIVPLGDDYVELVAIVDEDEARGTPFGDWVRTGTGRGDAPVGWAVATDDIEAVASRLGLTVSGGARTRPDGTVLSWRLAGIERMLAAGAFPIFIEWGIAPEDHPGRMEAPHRIAPTGLAWVSVRGDTPELEEWLGSDHGLPLRIEPGEPSIVAAAIATSNGEIVLS